MKIESEREGNVIKLNVQKIKQAKTKLGKIKNELHWKLDPNRQSVESAAFCQKLFLNHLQTFCKFFFFKF